MKKAVKYIRNLSIGLAAFLLVLLLTLQIVFRPKLLTGIVNSLAAEYVDGQVNFREVRAHAIKSFPYLKLDMADFSITYPHQRYARYDSLYPAETHRRFSLLKAGYQREAAEGEELTDTLASFRKLSVSVNYMAFIGRKAIHVHNVELTRPRIFAHYFDSTAANWDILPLGSGGEDADTASASTKPLPPIVLDQISLSDRPLIIFTNPADTLHGMFSMRRLSLEGKLETADIQHSRAKLSIDTLFVSGRLPADTVAFRLQHLRAEVKDRHVALDAEASASLWSALYGRLRVPLTLMADADFPEHESGELETVVNALELGVSSLKLKGEGRIFLHQDGLTDLDVQVKADRCPLGQLAREYENIIPVLKKIQTDALLSASASAKGSLGNGKMPVLNAQVKIPMSSLSYSDFAHPGRLALDASVVTDEQSQVTARLKQLLVDVAGARADVSATVKDALGKDPLITLDAGVNARVDSLTQAFTREMGILGNGSLKAALSGKARLSQLDMVHIGAANLNCDIEGRDLHVRMPSDSLDAQVPSLKLNLATKPNKIDKSIRQGARVLALKADVDTLDVTYGSTYVKGGKLLLLAQNSADILKGGSEMTPLMGLLKVGNLRMRDSDGMAVGVRDNVETIRIEPATRERQVPRLSMRSSSGRLRGRMGSDIVGLRDLKFDLSATRHVRPVGFEARRERLLDSLQRVYPGVPRDSLFLKSREARLARESRDEFASADVKISLSKALQDYVRNWDVEGNISLESGRITTPSFPLKTSISAVQGSFDNDTLDLGNITLRSGASDLSASARLTGLRRSMLGRGNSLLKLKADVRSDYIDANELMRGYAYYLSYAPQTSLADASDEAVESSVGSVELPDSSVRQPLLVIPSNLAVDFTLEASGIKYDSLEVSWAACDVAMRDRTLQVTNALAASNMGDIYFEGFYSTRSKRDLKAGFDLNLVNITAEKVITLFPAVDTLMPLLNYFVGDLDCELAATTDLDTCMNVVLPSVDGIMKISGKNLGLMDSPELAKITKLLKFKNRSRAVIDNMSVTGLVRDNVLEVFPFVLDVDRYLLAASGTQHLTQEFDYHVSVIKSPAILKFGVNVWGPDFDHIHYGVGKARYRSANVPVYTKQLDTAQYSLVASIHNIFELGVEKAMEENRSGTGFGVPASASTSAPASASEGVISEESFQKMEVLLTDVLEQTGSRREALKEEVIRLEAQAAKKPSDHE